MGKTAAFEQHMEDYDQRFTGWLILSYNAICSAMLSLRLQSVDGRKHRAQRSSLHHWQ